MGFKFLCLITSMLLATNCIAQRQVTIINVQGIVKVDNRIVTKPLTKIDIKKTLIISNNSVCEFIDNYGNPYKVTGPATVKLKKIIPKVYKGKNDYVHIERLDEENQVWSHVSDGPGFYIYEPVSYTITHYIQFLNNRTTIKWLREEWVEENDSIIIEVQTLFGETLYRSSTVLNCFNLDLTEYYEYSQIIVILTLDDKKETISFINNTNPWISYDGALNALINGFFLESRGSFFLAKDYYEKAVFLDGSAAYKKFYEKFLERYKKYNLN